MRAHFISSAYAPKSHDLALRVLRRALFFAMITKNKRRWSPCQTMTSFKIRPANFSPAIPAPILKPLAACFATVLCTPWATSAAAVFAIRKLASKTAQTAFARTCAKIIRQSWKKCQLCWSLQRKRKNKVKNLLFFYALFCELCIVHKL